ncbi:solute carrier family 2, facilitated glucose transporter member 1-like [Styela clava]
MDDSEESKSCNGNTETHESTNGTNGISEFTPVITDGKPARVSVNSNYCMWTLLITTQSTMMSIGLAVGALNPTLTIMSKFYNETYMGRYDEPIPGSTKDLLIALTVSMLLAGGFLGALSLGLFVKLFTRKHAMVVINSINILAVASVSIAGYFIPSYEAIIIGRFVMGFVAGIAMNVIPMIISETSTKKRSPFYLSLIGVNLSLGGLIGLMMGYKQVMGNDELWPILLAIPAIPSLVYVLFSPWLPETPSYLVLIGNKKAAFQTLKKLRIVFDESLLHEELVDIQREQDSQGHSDQAVSLTTMFKDDGYRWQLFLVVMVFLESQFCGINGVGMYTDKIFIKAGIHKDFVTYASTIVYAVQFFVALAGSKAVDKWGPRRLSIFWSFMMAIMLTLLTISWATVKSIPNMTFVSVAAVTVYVLSWACGPNITLFPLIAALTTEPTREASFKFGGGLFWIASWFVGFIPTYFMKYLGSYAYLPWAFCNLFFTIFFYFLIPETRGKTSEELQTEIHNKRKPKLKNADTSMQPLNSDEATV